MNEGSVTAWATFGAAMASANAAVRDQDRRALVDALESLAAATQELVDALHSE